MTIRTFFCFFIIHRSAAESESLSEESDLSGKDQWFSNGSPNHDDSAEFSISYHKANQRNGEDMLNRTTHAPQLHAVRGFTCVVDEISTSQETVDQNPTLEVTDDKNLNLDFGLEMQKENHLRKSMSHPPNGYAGGQAFENELGPQRADGRNGSSNKEAFVRVSEISLRTQPSQVPPPSRPPPVVEDNKGDSSKFVSNYDTLSSEGTSGHSSPSFFDVEIDASSSAAASAAAMKEAMEKAQAKLRSAKELMERKKESSHCSVKLASKKDIKEKEAKVSKTVDECARIKNEKVKGTCEREDGGKTLLVRDEKEKVRKTGQEVPEFLEGEQPSNASPKFVKEKLGKELRSSKGSSKIDEASEWKEATQFFELITTDEPRKAFEQANGKKILVQNTKNHEPGSKEKAAMEALEQESEHDRRVKAVRETHELKELEEKNKVAKEPCGWEENVARLQAEKEACKHKNHEKKIKVTQEVCALGEIDKSFTMAKQNVETKKKIAGTYKSEKYEDQVELKEKETKFKVEQAINQKDNEQKPMEADKLTESEKRLEQSCESVDNEERKKEALGHEGNEKRLKKSFERALCEKKVKMVLEQDENERLREVLEKVENEKRLKEAILQQVNEESIKQALEQEKTKKQIETRKREESEKRLKEACEMDDYEKRLKFPHGMDDLKKSLKAFEQEDNRKRSTKAQDREERQEKLQEAFMQAETQNFSKETSEWEESEEMLKDAVYLGDLKRLNKIRNVMNKDENRKEVKLTKKVQVLMEEDLGLSDEACEKGYTKKFQATELASNNDKITGKIKAPQEALSHGENRERTEPSNNQRLQGVVEIKTVSVDTNLKTSTRAEENLEYEEYQFWMDNTKESLAIDDSVKKGTREMNIRHEVSDGESGAFGVADVLIDELLQAAVMSQGDLEHGKNPCKVEDAYQSLPVDDSVKAGEDGSGIGQPKTDKTKSFSPVDSIPENQEKECNHEWKAKEKNLKQCQDALIQEGNKNKVIPNPLVKEFVENKRKSEVAQPAMLDGKQNNQKSAQHVDASQTTERKEKNANEPLMTGEKETERMKKQREIEDERLRKIEEEREREREREKDRMAIDFAKLEARERAYAEAHERAERAAVERATAEARQRAMSEARERLEKACAEAREKSLLGKAAMEARLRAERAAVERATMEARERAAEKAMAERAAFETRERIQRSVSDKFSASSSNNGMRQSSSFSVSSPF